MKRTFHLMRSSIVLVRRMSGLTTAFRRLFLLLISFSVTFFSQAQAPVIDGDPSDWPGVFTNGAITIKNFVDDPVNSSADDIFTNGSSDVNPISTWAWTTSSANDKNDIGHAGIALVGTKIYFFSDRYANNGDAAIGIWILKDNVGKVAGGSFSGAHTNGDVLVVSHFVNGGTVADRKAFVWMNGALVEDTSLTIADFAVAVNTTSIAAPVAWNYVPKAGTAGIYPPNSFFEGFINLASSNLQLDVCFSSFIIETRNSQSLNASLEDLTTGAFSSKPLTQQATGSIFCSNLSIGTVSIGGSELGVTYQLKKVSDNSNVQAAMAGTGSALTWTGLPAGSYYILAINSNTNCQTIIGNPTSVILNPIPSAPQATGASRCGPGTLALSASGSLNCDSLLWFSDAGLLTRVNTGSGFQPNLSLTKTYWIICKSINGCTSGVTTLTATINPVPNAPGTTGANRCGPGVVTLGATGGVNCDSLLWFSDAGLTTRVNTGSSFSPNLSTTTTYWVICKAVNGCTSSATMVTATINPATTAPITTGANRCGPGVITLGATGGVNCDSLLWFSDVGLTTRVNVGSSFSPSLSTTTTYWVICKTVNGCTSSATMVTATINPATTAPITTGANRCGPGTVILGATGGVNCDSLLWFSDAGLTTRVNVGSSFSPNLSATATYWVICKTVNGCTSSATMVTATINPATTAPITTGANRCGPGTITLGATGGVNCDSLLWFSDAGLTTRVNVGSSFSPNLSTTTTYWVICKTVNGCTSGATTVTATVNPIPNAPVTTGGMRCGPGTVTLGATGGVNCDSLIWFSDAGLTTRVNTGSSFAPNISATTTYWVICKTVNGCMSNAATVIATFNPAPSAPVTTGDMRCGPGTVALSATGGVNCDSLIWFSNAGLTTRVNVGSSFSPNVSGTTTYWVICKTVNGCTSSASTVTATINQLPVVQSTIGGVHCGPGIVTLGATGGINCDSLIWFSDAGLTTRVNVGSSFSPNLSTTTTYWVICKSLNGCISSPKMVTATINICGPTHCTYTQGYYGNKNGNSCDGDTTWQNPIALINHLLVTDLIIGNGGKSVKIPVGAGATLNSVMPGGHTPVGLTYNGQCVISTTAGSCFATNYLTSQGRINNVLLSQTITLSLNGRMQGGGLLSVPIDHGYLTTQKTSGCGSSSAVVPCTPTYTTAIAQYWMNENVVNYLTNFNANPATVADLLALANDVLGGALTPGQPGAHGNIVPSYSNINDAVDAINNGFDGCRQFLGYNIPLCPIPQLRMSGNTETTFNVYPNPSGGTFNVVLLSAPRRVQMTVTDLNGRIVMTKTWNDNYSQNITLDLNGLNSGIYLLQVNTGSEVYRSKLMIK